MSLHTFDFEKPILDLEEELENVQMKIQELDASASRQATATAVAEGEEPVKSEEAGTEGVPKDAAGAEGSEEEAEPAVSPEEAREELDKQVEKLQKKLARTRKKVYENLTPWQRVQIARHLARPHLLDYVELVFNDWTELHGDRQFADDPAMVCGFAMLDDQPVAIVGQQKGTNTRENVERNFGMAHPEGYRKAMRVMKLANKFKRPIIALVDTPGAYPGLGSEERGVAEAIARNMKEMYELNTPIIVVVIGEGASGGAIGIGVGDKVLMFENAWYTVISPEGCASILWRDAKYASLAADALKLTSKDLIELGIVDEEIAEPLGGAHHDPAQAAENLKTTLLKHIKELQALRPEDLKKARFEKYRKIGKVLGG